MALDYATIMGNSQTLVPDFRAQLMQDAQIKAFQQEATQRGLENQQKQVAFTRQQQFQRAVQVAVHSGDPHAIAQVMVEFPEFAAQLKPGNDAANQQGQQRNLTQMGAIYTRAQNGDFTGAAGQLQARIDADRAAGLDTADDEELLIGLKSPDPAQQKIALATVGMHLAAAAGPDKFADIYGKINPTDKTSPFEKEYEYRVREFGKDKADEWAAMQDEKFIPVQAGGSVYRGSDLINGGSAAPPTQTGGGDPASTGGLVMPVRGTFGDGLGVSRDGGKRRHNGLDIDAPLGSPVNPIAAGRVIQVGSDPKSGTFVKVRHADGSTSSYSHLGHVTVKTGDTIAPGQPLGTVGTTGNATGPVLHLVMRDPNGNLVDPRAALGTRHGGAPVKVKSVQQANKLPAGTHYITPDGQEFVR